jgi:O-antigen ligase
MGRGEPASVLQASQPAARVAVVAAFLLPYLTLRLVPGRPFTISDAMFAVAFALVLPHVPVRNLVARELLPWTATSLCFLCAVLIATFASPDTLLRDALGQSGQYAFVFFALPLLLHRLSDDETWAVLRALVIGFSASVMSGLALLSIPTVAAGLQAQGLLVGRGRDGLFTGVSMLVRIAVLLFPLLYLGWAVRRWSAAFALLNSFVFMVAVLVSRAVTGFLATATVLIVLVGVLALMRMAGRPAARALRKRRGGTVTASVVAMMLLAAWLGSGPGAAYLESFRARVLNPLDTRDLVELGSFEVRVALAEEAFELIARHPLTGVGPGGYRSASDYDTNVHNVFLLAWAEVGLLGAVAVAIVLVQALWSSRLVYTTARWSPPMVAGLASVAALVWVVVTTTYLYPRGVAVPLLLSWRLVAVPAVRRGVSASRRSMVQC